MAKSRLRFEFLDSRALPSATLANGILTIEGTEARDVIVVAQRGTNLSVAGQQIDVNGSPVANVSINDVTSIVINSLGGNDRIKVANLQLPVTVDAGPGNDWFFGTPGNDTVIGGSGNDIIIGAAGNDNLSGGSGNDRVLGSSGDDNISGDDDNDVLLGEVGDDSIFGGSGNDNLSGGNNDDSLNGEVGDDRLNGGNGNDDGRGGDGDDSLFGSNGNDHLSGELGDDSLNGGSGNDDAFGDDGNDHVNGEAGDDSLLGGIGDDSVSGGNGNDDCNGEDGDDSVSGGSGSDDCLGGGGDDSLTGGSGNDNCDGGGGVDHVSDDDSDNGGNASTLRVEGTVVAVDSTAQTVTIQKSNGTQVTVTVNASTKIEVDEAHATLADIIIGTRGEAKFGVNGVATEVETGVEVSGGNSGGGGNVGQFRVEGTVTAIDSANKTVTIRRNNGTTVSVIVVANTKIEVNDEHASFADLVVGVRGEARYTADGIATKLEIEV